MTMDYGCYKKNSWTLNEVAGCKVNLTLNLALAMARNMIVEKSLVFIKTFLYTAKFLLLQIQYNLSNKCIPSDEVGVHQLVLA